MLPLDQAFKNAFGAPVPATPSGLAFTNPGWQRMWQKTYDQIGAGWYHDRFLYLFGPAVQALEPCLEAWSFLVPSNDDRLILGRNAYGAIVFADDANSGRSQVGIVDPLSVDLVREPDMDLWGFLASTLPENRVPFFLDDGLYRAWREASGRALGDDEILGIGVPLTLGGARELDNFNVETIVDYYRATGPIYARAFAERGASKP